jgi:hypothetical protein
MVMLTYYDMFWVAHYTMDMASNLYNGYGIEFMQWLWFEFNG